MLRILTLYDIILIRNGSFSRVYIIDDVMLPEAGRDSMIGSISCFFFRKEESHVVFMKG